MTTRAKKRTPSPKGVEAELKAADPHRRGIHDTGAPTDFGCPDCRGVLTVRDSADAGFLTLQCRVGHSYSIESLIVAKEDAVEASLWTAIGLYEELAIIHRFVAARARKSKDKSAASLERRAQRALDNAVSLRAVLARDSPADIEPLPLGRRR